MRYIILTLLLLVILTTANAQLNVELIHQLVEHSKDEYDRTMGFVNFGEVEYVSHHGSQPMNITWQLKTPMPHFMWKQAAKLAVG